ncbi:MAG: hypothetical protein VCA34_00900 [Roseibacillus sp.]
MGMRSWGGSAILKIEGKKVSLAGTVETGRFPAGVELLPETM